MNAYNKEMRATRDKILMRNSLILFNLDNEPIKFSYQRHICSNFNEMPGENEEERIINSIILVLSLWYSWEIHIQNSKYPYKWYGCVQIENQWLINGKNTPPYVIFNSEIPDEIQNFVKFRKANTSDFPFDINSFDLMKSKGVFIKKAYFEDNSIVWRLCHS
jgi:hypothetical protein